MEGGEKGRAPARFLFGRRRGRGLRPGRRALLETTLPRVRVVLPEGEGLVDPRALFSPPAREAWLEIGFGSGEHLAQAAKARPDVGLVGCEAYLDGIASLLRYVERESLGNVRVFPDDARRLLPRLAEASLARVYLLFPDPWPKTRHHKRRFVSTAALDELAFVQADGGELVFATDHNGYLCWTLERVLAHPAYLWPARGPEDWRVRPYPEPTRYEAKAAREGRRSTYLRFRRRPRG